MGRAKVAVFVAVGVFLVAAPLGIVVAMAKVTGTTPRQRNRDPDPPPAPPPPPPPPPPTWDHKEVKFVCGGTVDKPRCWAVGYVYFPPAFLPGDVVCMTNQIDQSQGEWPPVPGRDQLRFSLHGTNVNYTSGLTARIGFDETECIKLAPAGNSTVEPDSRMTLKVWSCKHRREGLPDQGLTGCTEMPQLPSGVKFVPPQEVPSGPAEKCSKGFILTFDYNGQSASVKSDIDAFVKKGAGQILYASGNMGNTQLKSKLAAAPWSPKKVFMVHAGYALKIKKSCSEISTVHLAAEYKHFGDQPIKSCLCDTSSADNDTLVV